MRTIVLALTAALAVAAPAFAADPLDARIDTLTHAWDHANYEVPASQKAQAAAAVAAEADVVAHQFPGRAEPLIWKAIALATEGGAKGGMGALALVKEAKATLEQAERLNPNALGDASIQTTLGSLYAQVPGFPVGFGDKDKARAYLKKAVAAYPNGLDVNYFYGDFLFRQGEYAEAVKALDKAMAAPPRPGRAVADKGRKAEAAALLAKARAKSS